MNTTWIFETSLWKPMRGITDPHLCFAAVYAPSTPLQTAPLTCSLSLLLHCSVVRYPAFVLSSFVLLSPSPDLNIQAVISLLLTINRYASMYDSTSQTRLTHLDYYTHAHSILYSFIIILLFFCLLLVFEEHCCELIWINQEENEAINFTSWPSLGVLPPQHRSATL